MGVFINFINNEAMSARSGFVFPNDNNVFITYPTDHIVELFNSEF